MANLVVSNGERINDLAEDLLEAADNIFELSEDIYGAIKSIGSDEAWCGQAYNAFLLNCQQYQPALTGLVTILQAFSKMCSNNVADAADTLLSEVEDAASMWN